MLKSVEKIGTFLARGSNLERRSLIPAGIAPNAISTSDKSEKQRYSLFLDISFLLLLFCSAIDGADQFLLNNCYDAIQKDLKFEFKSLTWLETPQTLTMALAAPLWGNLADRYSRKWLLIAATTGWAIVTAMIGMISNYWVFFSLRLLNGIFLATLNPLAQSIIADKFNHEIQGAAFGLSLGAVAIGGILASAIGPTLSGNLYWGYFGWRLIYVFIGFLSLLTAVAIFLFFEEPYRPPRKLKKGFFGQIADEINYVFTYFKIRSFALIVVQGIFGCIPWGARKLNTYFLQSMNMPNHLVSIANTSFQASSIFGHPIGGYFGDMSIRYHLYRGRIVIAQVSELISIPIFYYMFVGVTKTTDSFWIYVFLNIALGLTCTWPASCLNRPLFGEFVSRKKIGSIMSWSVCIEGVAGAFGGGVVGWVAEAYGFREPMEGEVFKPTPSDTNALGMALVTLTVIPSVICFVFYSMLHFTYNAEEVKYAKELTSQVEERMEHSERKTA